MSGADDKQLEFKVSIPVSGTETPGKIRWSVDLGAHFKSDCGNFCIPVSREDWDKLKDAVDPKIGVSISIKL